MKERYRIVIVFLNIDSHGKCIKMNDVLLKFMSNYLMGKLSKRVGCSHKNMQPSLSQQSSEKLVICDGKKKLMNLN